MEQKDPNTVSGLLKLHLRENGLLSQQSLDQLLPHVGSRDHVRCVSPHVGSRAHSMIGEHNIIIYNIFYISIEDAWF